jgi:hypothetical protein
MSMKKSDLDKQLGKKVGGQMKVGGAAGRFGQGAGDVVDRREQRRADAAAGLVPFACKLPADLASALREKSAGREDGINGLVAELLKKALK